MKRTTAMRICHPGEIFKFPRSSLRHAAANADVSAVGGSPFSLPEIGAGSTPARLRNGPTGGPGSSIGRGGENARSELESEENP